MRIAHQPGVRCLLEFVSVQREGGFTVRGAHPTQLRSRGEVGHQSPRAALRRMASVAFGAIDRSHAQNVARMKAAGCNPGAVTLTPDSASLYRSCLLPYLLVADCIANALDRRPAIVSPVCV